MLEFLNKFIALILHEVLPQIDLDWRLNAFNWLDGLTNLFSLYESCFLELHVFFLITQTDKDATVFVTVNNFILRRFLLFFLNRRLRVIVRLRQLFDLFKSFMVHELPFELSLRVIVFFGMQ